MMRFMAAYSFSHSVSQTFSIAYGVEPVLCGAAHKSFSGKDRSAIDPPIIN